MTTSHITALPPAQLTIRGSDSVVVLHAREAEFYGLKNDDVFFGAKVVIVDEPLQFDDGVA